MVPKMVDVVGDIHVSEEELEKSAVRIKRWFHTDKFLKFIYFPSKRNIISLASQTKP